MSFCLEILRSGEEAEYRAVRVERDEANCFTTDAFGGAINAFRKSRSGEAGEG